MKLPETYVLNILNQYSRDIKYIKHSHSYRGACPFCNEGSSLGEKTRLNYYVSKDLLICYNCSKTLSSLYFVKELTKKSFSEIREEVSENYDFGKNIQFDEPSIEKKKSPLSLPYNSINLSDEIQIQYYRDEPVVKDALKYIQNRRLNTAINRTTFYISLNDYIHANRLIIPFQNMDKKIIFYQTRAIYPKDEYPAKYLSQLNTPKAIFGLNNINHSLNYLFIFEGPIDACFCINGLSMAGLQISDFQKDLLQPFFLFQKIWILDNQLSNPDVIQKNMKLIDNGETIFLWPKKYNQFKDVNELCCALKLDSIDPNFFIKNSYSGLAAKTHLLALK